MCVHEAIHISVVSHGQGSLVSSLLEDLEEYCRNLRIYVTVTLNIPESVCFNPQRFTFPIEIKCNPKPQGFAANHNEVFWQGQKKYHFPYFCVVNPDIRFSDNVLLPLLRVFETISDVGIAAPLVFSPDGVVEDSGRCFPSLYTPLFRFFGMERRQTYPIVGSYIEPDWVAGMFLLFPSAVFSLLRGFDERYFLYYEDIDLCARLRLKKYRVILEPSTSVVHDARRDSHHKLKYFLFHLRSIIRLFSSPHYWRAVWMSPVSSSYTASTHDC